MSCEFKHKRINVMAGRSRPKDGVASLAYVPAMTNLKCRIAQNQCDLTDPVSIHRSSGRAGRIQPMPATT